MPVLEAAVAAPARLARGWPAPPEALLARARRGDALAFLDLAAFFELRVYSLCWRLSGSAAAAERFGHEVLLSAWRELSSGGGPDAGHALADSIYRSCVSRICRPGPLGLPPALFSRGEVVPLPPPRGSDAAPGRFPSEGAAMGERLSLALGRLPDSARWVLVLRDLDGRSYPELAGLLSQPEMRLRETLVRARLMLSELLLRMSGERLRPFPGPDCAKARLYFCSVFDGGAPDAPAGTPPMHLLACGDCRRLRDALYHHLAAFQGEASAPPPPYFRGWLSERLLAERSGIVARLAVAVRHPSVALKWGTLGALATLIVIFGLRALSSVEGGHPPASSARPEPVFRAPRIEIAARPAQRHDVPPPEPALVTAPRAVSVPFPPPFAAPRIAFGPVPPEPGLAWAAPGAAMRFPPAFSAPPVAANRRRAAGVAAAHRRIVRAPVAVQEAAAPRIRTAPPTLAVGVVERTAGGGVQVVFSFDMAARGIVRLSVSDAAERQVAVVFGDTRPAGTHRIAWVAEAEGRPLAPGRYVARINTLSGAAAVPFEIP